MKTYRILKNKEEVLSFDDEHEANSCLNTLLSEFMNVGFTIEKNSNEYILKNEEIRNDSILVEFVKS